MFAIINVIVVQAPGRARARDRARAAGPIIPTPARWGPRCSPGTPIPRSWQPCILLVASVAAIVLTLRRSDRRQAAGHRQAGGGARQGPGPGRQDGVGEAVMITLTQVLALSGILFAIAVAGVFLNRKNIIVLLMCIELMLLAVNFNFVAFSRFLGDISGQVFVFFILTVAAAEAAIGLAILVVLFRERRTIDVEDLDTLQG